LDTKKPQKVVGLTADSDLPNMEALAQAHAYATALQSTTAYPQAPHQPHKPAGKYIYLTDCL